MTAHITPTALYRIYDVARRLLYVGITGHLLDRISTHEDQKQWWTDVAAITVEHIPTREAALAAEVTAIKTERPAYNIVHSVIPRPRRREVRRTAVTETTFDGIRARSEEDDRARIHAARELLMEVVGPDVDYDTAEAFISDVEEERIILAVTAAVNRRTGETITRDHAIAIIDQIDHELADSVERVITAYDTDRFTAAQALDLHRAAQRWLDRHAR